jgi:hypothetical protein
LLFAGWLGFGGKPKTPRESAPQRDLSWTTLAVAATQSLHRTRNIEDIRVGQRVVARNPDLTDAERRAATAVDPATWKLVGLHAESRWPDGTLDTFEIEALQPPKWLAEHRARVGAVVPIPTDLAEMGVPEDLSATVVSLAHCPTIEAGPGSVVLTTINHFNNLVFELTLADSDGHEQSVRPTGWHNFHRQEGDAWVSAADLREGDVLRALDGPLVVVGLKRIRGTHRVYNMTVEGEHVYYVSRAALLGHNVGCGPLGNTGSGSATTDDALAAAENWLGNSYTEIAPGVYRSNGNPSNQFRMTGSDLGAPDPHVHFESIGPDGRTIVENGHVYLK